MNFKGKMCQISQMIEAFESFHCCWPANICFLVIFGLRSGMWKTRLKNGRLCFKLWSFTMQKVFRFCEMLSEHADIAFRFQIFGENFHEDLSAFELQHESFP